MQAWESCRKGRCPTPYLLPSFFLIHLCNLIDFSKVTKYRAGTGSDRRRPWSELSTAVNVPGCLPNLNFLLRRMTLCLQQLRSAGDDSLSLRWETWVELCTGPAVTVPVIWNESSGWNGMRALSVFQRLLIKKKYLHLQFPHLIFLPEASTIYYSPSELLKKA